MKAEFVDDKDPAEIVPITLDFGKQIALIPSIDSAVVSVTLIDGVDPDFADTLLGVHQIDGLKVMQLFRNGVNGAGYLIRADIVSGSIKLAMGAAIRVTTIVVEQ